MKKLTSSRRKFIKNISLGGIAFANATALTSFSEKNVRENKKRIGIIGLVALILRIALNLLKR